MTLRITSALGCCAALALLLPTATGAGAAGTPVAPKTPDPDLPVELLEVALPFGAASVVLTPDRRHVVAADDWHTVQVVRIDADGPRPVYRPSRLNIPTCDLRIMGYDRDGARAFIDAYCMDGRWLRAVPLRDGAKYWNYAVDPSRRIEGTLHALADGSLLMHYTADLSGSADAGCTDRDAVCLTGRVDWLDGATGKVLEGWNIRETYAEARVAADGAAALVFDYGRLWRFEPGRKPRSVAVRASIDEAFLVWDGGPVAGLVSGARLLPFSARGPAPAGKAAAVGFLVDSAVPAGAKSFLVAGGSPERSVAEVRFAGGAAKTRPVPGHLATGLLPGATERFFLIPDEHGVTVVSRRDLTVVGRLDTERCTGSVAVPGGLVAVGVDSARLWMIREK